MGVATPYHPSFYLPLFLLHLSLLVRLVGVAMGMFEWMRMGAALNALALLAFILSTVAAVVRGKISRAAPASDTSR